MKEMAISLEDLVEFARQDYLKSLETDNKEDQEKRKKLFEGLTFKLANQRTKKIQEEFNSYLSLGSSAK